MEWISVKDRLPEIPEGKYGLCVIVATFDSTYEELNPGNGYEVHEVHFGEIRNKNGTLPLFFEGTNIEKDFYDLDSKYGPMPLGDPVTHWMPLPSPPVDK